MVRLGFAETHPHPPPQSGWDARLKSMRSTWILKLNKGHSQMATIVANGRERIPPKSSLCFACPAKKACSPPRDLNQISIGHLQGWIDSVPLTVLSLKAAVKGNTRFSNITSRSLIFSNFDLSASYCFEISSALSWKNKKQKNKTKQNKLNAMAIKCKINNKSLFQTSTMWLDYNWLLTVQPPLKCLFGLVPVFLHPFQIIIGPPLPSFCTWKSCQPIACRLNFQLLITILPSLRHRLQILEP